MTEKELCQKFNINIHIFQDDGVEDDEVFYIDGIRTVFVSDKIAKNERVKYILHEIGHKGQLPHLYQIFREKYELQANRNMIHHLIKSELDDIEDYTTFNYLAFMEKYDLNTMADEAMVMEEFYNLTDKE